MNHKSCRIVKRNLDFNGGMIYGIDCLLNPPSVGGRCDYKHTIDFTVSLREVQSIFTEVLVVHCAMSVVCSVQFASMLK